jgi:hypothetical protein
MLGRESRGDDARRGQRVLVLQCCVRGSTEKWSEQWVNVCSGFLEGNEELGAVNALFSVGLSASSNLYEGAMRAQSLVANRELFTDCTVGVSMYMLVYRSRCPYAAQDPHRRARSS